MENLKSLVLFVAILATLAACSADDSPLTPAPEQESTAITGTDQNPVRVESDRTLESANVQTGSGVFTFDGIVPFECAGEDVRSIVYAPYTWRIVETPTGDYIYTEFWDPKLVTGTLTGMDTGTVWRRTKNVSPYIERDTGGGMAHYTFKSTFVSDTAPTIEVREVYHVSRDAAGNLTATVSQFNCWTK